ncbi:MAG: hypothetical protein ABH807_03175 [Candidatus Shapirobacteria bacterium]
MKKIISLLIILITLGLGAAVFLKKPVQEPIQKPVEEVEIIPEVRLKLVSAVNTVKVNQDIKLEIILEPLFPQKIDGLDIILNFVTQIDNSTPALELVRSLQQNNQTIISFLALNEDQAGFVLTQPLVLGELKIVPTTSGPLLLDFSEKSAIIEAVTSKKIPVQLEKIRLDVLE